MIIFIYNNNIYCIIHGSSNTIQQRQHLCTSISYTSIQIVFGNYYADVDFAFEVSFKKAHTRSNYSDGDSTLSVSIRPLTYFLNKN